MEYTLSSGQLIGRIHQQDLAEHSLENSQWKPDQLGQEAAECTVGLPNCVQDKYPDNTVPVSFWIRSGHADRVSYSEFADSSTGKVKWEGIWEIRLATLWELEEHRIASILQLELEQWRGKAFVNQHRKGNEKMFEIGKLVLVFQTRMGKMPGKLRFRWTGP